MAPGGTGTEFNAYQSMTTFGSLAETSDRPLAGDDDYDETAPRGFITILLFDKNKNLIDAGWDQIGVEYDQDGITTKDPFDLLSVETVVQEEGFAYIFISNENPSQVDIHFDDLKVVHKKTNVIQYNEYYPFGLSTSASWTRENNSNNYLYNAGSEINASSGWYDLPFRNYDAALGRFMQVDPLAVLDYSASPFVYGGNNPVFFNDPMGLLKASVSQINAFISRALSGHGGHWSEDAASPTYFDDDQEQGEWILDNWSSFGFVTNGEGGSAMQDFAFARVKGLATNTSWVHWKYNLRWSSNGRGNISFKYLGEGQQKGPGALQDDLVVNFYLPWNTEDDGGVIIDLTFKNTRRKYKDVRWVQTVWTNNSNVKSPFNDPAPPDNDDLPFYWTRDENRFHVNYDGTDAHFKDVPSRDLSQDLYWIAELSVVSRLSNGTYAPIETITYGFGISQGNVVQYGMGRNVTPSSFHLSTFMNKKFKL
jgi:RHS repeat-associated protein